MSLLDTIKPEHLWYLVGLIATDGCLSKDGRHITLTVKDENYLFLLKHSIGLKGSVGKKVGGGSQEKNYSYIHISDVVFYRFLEHIGLHFKKSLTMGPLDISQNYVNDFLRGVIDGDGCIMKWIHRSNGKRQWSLRIVSAAPRFIQWLKEIVESDYQVNGKLHCRHDSRSRNDLYVLKFGKLAAQRILQHTYYEDALSLPRKHVLAKACLQDKALMVNYGDVLRPGVVTGSQVRLKI